MEKNKEWENSEVIKNSIYLNNSQTLEIVKNYQTPFYLYDLKRLYLHLNRVKQTFPFLDIYYSMKANPHPKICEAMISTGFGLEVSSEGELVTCLDLGAPRDKLLISGPAKTETFFNMIFRNDVKSINVDSFGEILVLSNKYNKEIADSKLNLRINPSKSFSYSKEVMGGIPSQFGVDLNFPNKLNSYRDIIKKNISGIQTYYASQILEANNIIKNFEHTLETVCKIHDQNLFQVKRISFGGGFGVPNDNSPPLNLEVLKKSFNEILHKYSSRLDLKKTKIILELGRYLVAEYGVFVTKVIDYKVSHKKNFVLTDGGINCFLRPFLMQENHPTFVLNKLNKANFLVADICGPLCTPFDILAKNIKIPMVNKGDYIGVFNAGAYGYTMSPINFLSQKKPIEVFL